MEDRHFKKRKGRFGKSKISNMNTLPEILAEIQALATVTEDQFEANLAGVVSAVQAYIAANPSAPAADPVATVVVTTQSGVSTTCIPQA